MESEYSLNGMESKMIWNQNTTNLNGMESKMIWNQNWNEMELEYNLKWNGIKHDVESEYGMGT